MCGKLDFESLLKMSLICKPSFLLRGNTYSVVFNQCVFMIAITKQYIQTINYYTQIIISKASTGYILKFIFLLKLQCHILCHTVVDYVCTAASQPYQYLEFLKNNMDGSTGPALLNYFFRLYYLYNANLDLG